MMKYGRALLVTHTELWYNKLYNIEKLKMNMQKWLVIVALMALMIVPAISAQLIYPANEDFNLKVPCIINGSLCSASSECYLTYISPETDTLVDNQSMTNSGAVHNYTIVNTSIGIYTATVSCVDQGFWGTSTFEILITNTGEEADTAKSIVDLAMLFGLLMFLGFSIMGIFLVKDVRGKFALYFLAHLLSIAISFIAWQSSAVVSYSPFLGGFFRIIFFVVLIAFLPAFFVGIFFIIKHHFINKNVMELVNAGYDQDDAERIAAKMARDE